MDKINIAVKVNGGFGTVLIRANYIHCLYKYLDDENIRIYAYAHKNDKMNDAIFKNQKSIFWYGNESAWKRIKDKDFDIKLVLDIYPDLIYANEEKIQYHERLLDIVSLWRNFKSDCENNLYFKELRTSKPYVYSRLMIEKKSVLNSADINGILGIENEFEMPIIINKTDNEVLRNFNLQGKKYITVQRGVNPKLGTAETPKLWPVNYYEELLPKLKEKYPEYLIVQLGESASHCKSMKGIDINLVGKTDWDDLKVLLKYATLHIDGECGMVHLRKALHAGPSVVLFAQTPLDFFGYDGNINLKSDACSHWCAELREDWEYNCIKGQKHAPCMYGLTSDFVFEKISDFLDGNASCIYRRTLDISGSVTKEIIQKYGDRLDSEYVGTYFSNEAIWDYEEVDIPVKDLFCTVHSNKGWEIVPISQCPAYKYFVNGKNVYSKYINHREKCTDNNIHSINRFENLIKSMSESNFSNEKLIIIGCNNKIKDGQHRAAILMHKYGPDYKIHALRVYKSEQPIK